MQQISRYAGLGSLDLPVHALGDFPQKIELSCDGERIPIPADCEGIVVLNVPSFMGGHNAWALGVGMRGQPQSAADGVIEVVGFCGSLHLGQCQVGLSRGYNLCQGRVIRIVAKREVPMQVDGEPWMQEGSEESPTELVIRWHGYARVLKRPASQADEVFSVLREALSACEDGGVVTRSQRKLILSEVESRLRQAGQAVC